MTETADVVVIGGGVNGCSIAFTLKRAGVKKVLLLDKRYIASGPTGRSLGIVRQHYTREPLACMARDSLRVFSNFAEEVGGSAGFQKTGAVFVFSKEGASGLRQTVEMHQRLGIRSRVLSRDELQRLEPRLSVEDLACGAYEPDSGHADPSLAANSYAEAAKQLGVEVRPKTEVTGFVIEGNRVTAVETSRGGIAAGTVINVAGPWGDDIARMVGAEIPIRPTRHAVVVLERPASWRGPMPVCYDMVNGMVLKPEGGSALSVSSIQHVKETAGVEAYAELPSYDETEKYAELAAQRFPVRMEGAAQGGWAGLYDETPDSQPVIDRVPHLENFYCAAGFSGHGFKLAPAVGKIMTELVTQGRCTTYDIEMFCYDRFEEGKSSAGAYRYGILG